MVLLGLHGRQSREPLPGRPDHHGAGPLGQQLAESIVGGEDIEAPQIVRGEKFGTCFGDMQTNGCGRRAADDDRVPAGLFQRARQAAARVALQDGSGQRALGKGPEAVRPRKAIAGERAGSEHDQIARRQGVDGGIEVFFEDVQGQRLAAQTEQVLVGRLFRCAPTGGQVYQ